MSQPAYTLSDDNTDAAAIARTLIGPAAVIALSLTLLATPRTLRWLTNKLVDAIEIREIILDAAAGDSE